MNFWRCFFSFQDIYYSGKIMSKEKKVIFLFLFSFFFFVCLTLPTFKFPQEYVVLNTEAPIPYYYDKRDPPVTNPEDPNYSSLRDPTRFADNFDLNKIPVFPREGPNKFVPLKEEF